MLVHLRLAGGGFLGEIGAGDAHVLVVGPGDLLQQVGIVGLETKAAQFSLLRAEVVHPIGAAGYAVAIAVAGVGQRQNSLFGDGFE